MYMRHEPEPHVLLFKVSLGPRNRSVICLDADDLEPVWLAPLYAPNTSVSLQRDKDYDRKHPPLGERRGC